MITFSATAATWAQEIGPGGRQLVFELSQRFDGDTNLELEPSDGPDTFTSDTRLSFGLLTETRNRRLEVIGGATARAVAGSSDEDSFDIDDPFGRFTYTMESARSILSFDGFVEQADLSRLSRFDGLVSDSGDLAPLGDIAEFEGAGNRTNYGIGSRLEVGRDTPVRLAFGVDVTGTEYDGTTDPALEDSFGVLGSTEAFLQLSPVLLGRVRLDVEYREEDDIADTRDFSQTLTVGFDYEASRTLTFSGEVGLVRDEERVFGEEDTDYEVNGSFSVDLEFPTTDVSLGVAQTGAGSDREFSTFASVARELPRGFIIADVGYETRESDPTIADEEEVFAGLGYLYEINNTSQLALGTRYLMVSSDDPETDEDQFSIAGSYSRQLTERINLEAGYQYRYRDFEDVSAADSHTVFFEIRYRTDSFF